MGGPSAPGALKINPAYIITQALKASAPSGPVNTAKLVAAVKTVEKMPVTTYYMDLTIKLAALAALSPPIYPFGDLQLEVGQSYSDSTGKSLTADATTGLYVDPSGTVETVSGIRCRAPT